METWNERFAKALAESDYKPLQLAKALGVSAPTVAAWLGAGDIKPAKNITGENLLRVCNLLSIRPEWLMFNEGEMRRKRNVFLSHQMSEIIQVLEAIDAMGGTEREDALYFMDRLLKRERKVDAKQA